MLEQYLMAYPAKDINIVMYLPYGKRRTVHRKLRNVRLTGVESSTWAYTPVRQWRADIMLDGKLQPVWGWSEMDRAPSEWSNDKG